MSRNTTSTTMQRGRLIHSQLVMDKSKEQQGPTWCETHTFTIHEPESLTKYIYQPTVASFASLEDMRWTINVWSKRAIGALVISKVHLLILLSKVYKAGSNNAKSRKPSDLQDEQCVPKRWTSFHFLGSKGFESRTILVTYHKWKPYPVGLNHSQFLSDHKQLALNKH